MNKYSSRIMSIAFVLLFGIAIFTVIIPQNVKASTINGSDNFDTQTAGLNPSGTFYTWASGSDGSTQITNIVSSSSPNSVKMLSDGSTVNGGNGGQFNFGTVSLRDSSHTTRPTNLVSIAFKFRIASSAAHNLERFNIGSQFSAFFNWDGVSAYQVAAQTYSGVGSTYYTGGYAPGLLIAPDTWNDIQFSNMLTCDGASNGLIIIVNGVASQSPNAPVTCTDPYTFTLKAIPSQQSSGCSPCPASTTMYIDNLILAGSAPPILALSSIASRTVTGLVGFDVDPFNQVVLARTDVTGTGTKINTYNANSPSLAIRGASPLTNACNQLDGVMAYSTSNNGKQFAGFVNCDSGHAIINDFSIRGGDLNSPDQSGTTCSGNTICDIDVSGAFNDACPDYHLPDSAVQIANIAAIPIDWSDGSNVGINHVQIGFAYSDGSNGNIGTWTIRQQTGLDQSCVQEVPFSSPGGTTQICSWNNENDGNDYIAAIGSISSTSAWQFQLDPFTLGNNLHTSLTAIPASLPSPYNHLNGIGCAGYDALVTRVSDGAYARLHIVGTNVGQLVWGPIIQTLSPVSRGVALSRDGKWGLIASTTDVKVINALTSATTATLTMPSGTFKEVRISAAGQEAWIATTTTIAEYDIHTATTISSVPDGCTVNANQTICRGGNNEIVPIPTGTSTGSSSGTGNGVGLNTADTILGINIVATATGLNISRNSVLLLIAVVIMGVFGIWLYRNTDSIMGLVLGILLGFLLSVAMGLILEWVMITLVLVLLIILGKMFFGGFYPGSGDE